MTEKRKIVEKGYDEIAEKYHAYRHIFSNRKEIERFANLLPRSAKVLDVGCGAGVPVARILVESGFDVTGVDFSEGMLKLAGNNVPKAEFIKQDMTKLGFADNSFDGLTAFYAIIHVPREEHSSLFRSFHRILKPKGILLVSMGSDEWEGTDDYHGARMFWSHYTPEKSFQIIKDVGFRIIFDKHIETGGEKHYWVLAKNKKGS